MSAAGSSPARGEDSQRGAPSVPVDGSPPESQRYSAVASQSSERAQVTVRLTEAYLRQLEREDRAATARSSSRPSRDGGGFATGSQARSRSRPARRGRPPIGPGAVPPAPASVPPPDGVDEDACALCFAAVGAENARTAWPVCGHVGHAACLIRYLRRLPEEEPVPLAVRRSVQDSILPPPEWLARCMCPVRGEVADHSQGLGIGACMQRWGDPRTPHSDAQVAHDALLAAAAASGISVEGLAAEDLAAQEAAAVHSAAAQYHQALAYSPDPMPEGIAGVCCQGRVAEWVSSCPPVRGADGIPRPGAPRNHWTCLNCSASCEAVAVAGRPTTAAPPCGECGQVPLWVFAIRQPGRAWWHCLRCGPLPPEDGQHARPPQPALGCRSWLDAAPPPMPMANPNNSDVFAPVLLGAAGLLSHRTYSGNGSSTLSQEPGGRRHWRRWPFPHPLTHGTYMRCASS